TLEGSPLRNRLRMRSAGPGSCASACVWASKRNPGSAEPWATSNQSLEPEGNSSRGCGAWSENHGPNRKTGGALECDYSHASIASSRKPVQCCPEPGLPL